MNQSVVKARKYIRSIPLKGVTSLPSRQPDPVVSGSNGVITTANVPEEKRPWVADSYLFCELAANAQASKRDDPIKWFGVFSDILTQIAWVIKSFDFSKYNPAGSDLTVSKVVLDVLAAIATDKQQEALKTFMDSLEADADAVTFFQHKAFNNQKAQFCISPCDADLSTGQLVLCIGAFSGTFNEDVTNFFFGTWKSTDVTLQTASQILSIDEDIFREVYPDLKERLVPYVKSNIIHVPFKE